MLALTEREGTRRKPAHYFAAPQVVLLLIVVRPRRMHLRKLSVGSRFGFRSVQYVVVSPQAANMFVALGFREEGKTFA